MRVFSFLAAVAISAACSAGELQYEFQGGDSLKVNVVGASKQTWSLVGDKTPIIVAAAIVGDRLIVEEFKCGGDVTPPHPGPNPPVPPPPPPPADDIEAVLWIEESSGRDAEQAAVLIDSELRRKMASKGIAFRVVDADVVDENGRTPDDLLPIISAAKAKGLPCVFALDKSGRTVLEAKVTDKASFEKIIDRLTGELQGRAVDPAAEDKTDDTPERNVDRKETEPEQNKTQPQTSCPTGTCPTVRVPLIRRR